MIVLTRRALLAALVGCCALLALSAHGVNTLHLSCPTYDSTTLPTQIIFQPASECVDDFFPGTATLAKACRTTALVGVNLGGTNFACTQSHTDGVTTVGAGHLYINCHDCPRFTSNGTTVQGLGRAVFLGPGTSACSASSFPVAGNLACSTQWLIYANTNGTRYSMSLSFLPEPNVSELVNITIMGWALFALIAGLIFGWKVVQRGTSQ